MVIKDSVQSFIISVCSTWNIFSVKWIEMKWNVTHFSTVDVKWKLMKLFFTNDREMRWNEVKFMKFSETRPWEPTKRFIEFYQKSVLVKLPSFQTYRSFCSSQRPTHRPHRPQESRHLHECTHVVLLTAQRLCGQHPRQKKKNLI